MSNRVKRPEREPDVVFPKEERFARVEVWVAEEVFCVSGYCFSGITSNTLNIKNSNNTMYYITSTAESPLLEGSKRQRAAREFLFNLELTLLLN
jgi:hypothetical protein